MKAKKREQKFAYAHQHILVGSTAQLLGDAIIAQSPRNININTSMNEEDDKKVYHATV